MLLKLILCAVTLSALVSAQTQVQTSSNSNKDLRACGVPEPVVSLVDHFGNYWLDQDARYIIEDPERSAYKTLSDDEERGNFIEAFWQRRDPTPNTIDNEFKDEHYRRIVYANERFSGRVPGWKTDRGRFYIMSGPPDSIEFTTLGALKQKQEEDRKKYPIVPGMPKQDEVEDLERYSMMPAEVWRYRYLEGIGREVTFGFSDECGCNDPHLKTSSSAPQFSPLEPLPDLTPQPPGKESGTTKSQTGSIETFVGGVKWPQTRFKDLEEVVTSKVRYNLLPFQAMANAVRATEYTDLVALTLQFQKRDLAWKENAGSSPVALRVFARFLNTEGRIAAEMEEEIKNFTDDRNPESIAEDKPQFSRLIPLRAGRYRLDIVVKDVNADKIGTWSRGVIVPGFYADEFKTSPLILADQIDTPNRRIYPIMGDLYIADVRIHPRLPAPPEMPVFHQGEQLGLFLQAYNLSPKPQSTESDAVIGYKIVNIPTGKIALESQETGKGGEQLTAHRMFSTAGMPQGEYAVCVTINDRIAHRSWTSSARVRIE